MYRQGFEQYIAQMQAARSMEEIPDVSVCDLSDDEQRLIAVWENFAWRVICDYRKAIRNFIGTDKHHAPTEEEREEQYE